MAYISKSDKHLGKISAILGILQGATWFILALICIVIYNKNENLPNTNFQSYMEQYQYVLQQVFLYDHPQDDSTIVTAKVFTIFMWINLIGNLIWVSSSILHIRMADLATVQRRKLADSFKVWGHVTLTIAAIDAVLVILLAADYDVNCMGGIPDSVSIGQKIHQEMVCTTIFIPVLTIAARGFVLWIINVALALKNIQIGKKFQQGAIQPNTLISIPRVNSLHQGNNAQAGNGAAPSYGFNHGGRDFPGQESDYKY